MMIIRQLDPQQYSSFNRYLKRHGNSSPLDASYEIRIDVDGCSYLLRLQTGGKRKVAVLQAIRVLKTEKRQSFELITRNPLLWCLLELVLFEKCR